MHEKRAYPGVAVILLLGWIVAPVIAETKLSVEVGWQGIVRQGRWTPIFVTAGDSHPRNVEIRLETGHDTLHRMRIHQVVTIGPEAATFALYSPLAVYDQDFAVSIVDAATEKRLARWAVGDEQSNTRVFQQQLRPDAKLIGVSGEAAQTRAFAGRFTDEQLFSAAMVEPRFLPSSAQGLDALDILILLNPNLEKLSLDQQNAIADWVRAGGYLVVCAGDVAPPPTSPITALLPGTFGELGTVDLNEKTLEKVGLPARFNKLPARVIDPATDAIPVAIFPDHPLRAFRHRVGLGQVLLVPTDVSLLDFRSSDLRSKFLVDLLHDFGLEKRPENPNRNYGYYGNDEEMIRQTAAIEFVGERIANIEGVGQFGFTYVAVVLVGLLLLVGPVDFLVLKKLGRQPMTWVTMCGWIVLVTLGALYVGRIFKSGNLFLRTVRLVDQAENLTVAQYDLMGLYSPQSRAYQLTVPGGSWWEPVGQGQYYRGGVGTTVIDFHQTLEGNQPLAMEVPVWNLRLLQSEKIHAAPAMLAAELKLEESKKGTELVGKITNLTGMEFRDLQVRMGKLISSNKLLLGPNASVEVRMLMKPWRMSPDMRERELGDRAGTQPAPFPVPFVADGQWFAAGNLAPDRTKRMAGALLDDSSLVLIVAAAEEVPADVHLEDQNPIERHWLFVRALVSLQK